MPSAHSPRWTFLWSASKSACLALMCSHCGESGGPLIFPSPDMLSPCHVMSAARCGVENILLSRGMRGKCLRTFIGTLDIPTRLYRGAWHIGHVSKSAFPFLNNTQPFLHASIASYLSPSRPNILLASPSLLGSEFGDGKITVASRCSISLMHAFVALCVRQTFMTIKVASNLDKLDPQKRGVWDSSVMADASWNAGFCSPQSPT